LAVFEEAGGQGEAEADEAGVDGGVEGGEVVGGGEAGPGEAGGVAHGLEGELAEVAAGAVGVFGVEQEGGELVGLDERGTEEGEAAPGAAVAEALAGEMEQADFDAGAERGGALPGEGSVAALSIEEGVMSVGPGFLHESEEPDGVGVGDGGGREGDEAMEGGDGTAAGGVDEMVVDVGVKLGDGGGGGAFVENAGGVEAAGGGEGGNGGEGAEALAGGGEGAGGDGGDGAGVESAAEGDGWFEGGFDAGFDGGPEGGFELELEVFGGAAPGGYGFLDVPVAEDMAGVGGRFEGVTGGEPVDVLVAGIGGLVGEGADGEAKMVPVDSAGDAGAGENGVDVTGAGEASRGVVEVEAGAAEGVAGDEEAAGAGVPGGELPVAVE